MELLRSSVSPSLKFVVEDFDVVLTCQIMKSAIAESGFKLGRLVTLQAWSFCFVRVFIFSEIVVLTTFENLLLSSALLLISEVGFLVQIIVRNTPLQS